MSAARFAKVRAVAIAAGLLVLCLALYVGSRAVQEDVYLAPASPLRWVLVDGRLRSLDLGPALEVEGYYYTAGDGPKLPGSEVQFRGDIDPDEAMNLAKDRLRDLGFEVTTHCLQRECSLTRPEESAAVTVVEDDGSTQIRVFIGQLS